MKSGRAVKRWLLFLLLPLALILPASAEEQTTQEMYAEQLEASGADEVWDKLPEETRQLLERLGIDELDAGQFSSLQPKGILENLLGLLSDQAGTPMRACGMILGIILLCALMDGVKQTVAQPSVSEVFGVICALAACAAVMIPVSGCIQRLRRAPRFL